MHMYQRQGSNVAIGYQLLSDAHGMPKEFQYLRVRIKTEQYRLLDWAHVAQLNEREEDLLIGSANKPMLIDVLDQQQRLLLRFGRYDEEYRQLRRPLLSDGVEDVTDSDRLIDGPSTKPDSPTESKFSVKRVQTDFQQRFPQTEELMSKALRFMEGSRRFPKKLAWASWDKEKVERLILKLTALNDFMGKLLNSRQLQVLADRQLRTEYQIMQFNTKMDHLVQLLESRIVFDRHPHASGGTGTSPVQMYLQSRGIADSVEELPETPTSDDNIASLAQVKALQSAFDSDTLTDTQAHDLRLRGTAREVQSVELPRAHIEIIDEYADHSDDLHNGSSVDEEDHRVEAYYTAPGKKKQQVWIEWKTYEPVPFTGAPDEKIHKRIKALAALLKLHEYTKTDKWRAPHCLGYFQDKDLEDEEDDDDSGIHGGGDDRFRFGLVFAKPPHIHPSTRATSLHDLLVSDRDIPSLTDRIALMKAITECIERFHAVNWLHKGLRSDNILFFSDTVLGDGELDFSAPYISGFDYSRPAQREDLTEKPPENPALDLYRHPRVHGCGPTDAPSAPFKKSYDIYSLGVILVEIAYWSPIDRVLKFNDLNRVKPSQTIKVRSNLLSAEGGYLKWVKAYLGNTVAGVIKACLQGPTAFGLPEGVDERNEDVGAKLQGRFYDEVVQKIGEMKV